MNIEICGLIFIFIQINFTRFRFLWPCIVSKVWREKNQQDVTIRCLLLTSISTCFGHHYAHLQEIKEPVTAFGVFWFCWKWLVAVVGRCLEGCEHYEVNNKHLIVTSCWVFSLHILLTMHGHRNLIYTKCSNMALVLLKMGIMMPETCWETEVNNKNLIVASCWFSSLHTLLTMHGHRNLKLKKKLTIFSTLAG